MVYTFLKGDIGQIVLQLYPVGWLPEYKEEQLPEGYFLVEYQIYLCKLKE